MVVDDQRRLLGPDAPARDVYRVRLDTADAERERIQDLRPPGRLACTHLRGNRTPARCDHLLATPTPAFLLCNHAARHGPA